MSAIGIVAILWLALTGQLAMYIHPRYFSFTVIMAILALLGVVAAFLFAGRSKSHSEAEPHLDPFDHHHDHSDEPGSGRMVLLGSTLSGLIVVGTVIALLILPPATLTSATVDQRGINDSLVVSLDPDDPQLVSGNYAEFTVKDWATLLRQGVGLDFLSDKMANISGFVTPDTSDPDQVFYLSRFVVTCCAVDARPVGVPVYYPGWQDEFAVDSWLELTGGFSLNPSVASAEEIVLTPQQVTPIKQPAEPYVYS